MIELSIVLPCYQEMENLKILLPQLIEVIKKMEVITEIIVVDTMKPMDDTKALCNSLVNESHVEVCYIPRRKGNMYGDAIRTGITSARGTYILVMDADGSHAPLDVERLYNEIKKDGYDIVIGSRYVQGGNSHNGLALKCMSYALNITYKIMFGLKLRDISNSFRIYISDKLKSLDLECDNFDVVEEILIRLKSKYPHILIKEIPVYFNKRLFGKSKRDLIKFVFSYIQTIFRLKVIQAESIK